MMDTLMGLPVMNVMGLSVMMVLSETNVVREREITMETKEKCVACHTVETEDGLCDDCFTELPMNVWVTVTEKGK